MHLNNLTFLKQYMFQNEEPEAFPAPSCEEQWLSSTVLGEAEGNNIVIYSDTVPTAGFNNLAILLTTHARV